jgi:hypothetical protein
LRNGRLNQTAYALYLFIRDIADGDLIGWIDQRLQAANSLAGPDRVPRMRNAVIAPLREIYGVSDKVLTMALSSLLLGAPQRMRLWQEVGASTIAIDTLVHSVPAAERPDHEGYRRGCGHSLIARRPSARTRAFYAFGAISAADLGNSAH